MGWVRRTWEREIVRCGKEEIQEMLASEMESCPKLQEPRVIYGDREYELLKIMEHETFRPVRGGGALSLHPGQYPSPAPPEILSASRSPADLAEDLAEDQPGAGGLPGPGGRALVPAIRKLWAGCPTPIHLGVPPRRATAVPATHCGGGPEGPGGLGAAGCPWR